MESSSQHSMRELEGRIQQVETLLRSPGWALFVTAMAPVVAAAKGKGRSAPSAHEMGLHFGVALAIEDVLAWPSRELSNAKTLLQDLSQRPLTDESFPL
jgi:hypothetical protein